MFSIYPFPSFDINDTGVVYISRDMGSVFEGSKHIPNFDNFKKEFSGLWRRTLGIEGTLSIVHGDLHEGNQS